MKKTTKKTTRKVEIDDDAKQELWLYIVNESKLYNQKKSIMRNIDAKVKRGTYKHALAPLLWLYWVDAGAKSYVREFGGGTVRTLFPKPLRESLAQDLADEYAEEIGEIGAPRCKW